MRERIITDQRYKITTITDEREREREDAEKWQRCAPGNPRSQKPFRARSTIVTFKVGPTERCHSGGVGPGISSSNILSNK